MAFSTIKVNLVEISSPWEFGTGLAGCTLLFDDGNQNCSFSDPDLVDVLVVLDGLSRHPFEPNSVIGWSFS